MKWTKQQQQAIDARDSSIIVSAAAGSGKTAVLTERLVKLLSDPESGVRADRIIVVTFTNDAAAELKKRLDSKLRALINERPGDRYLMKQQTLLQSAKISTINSFCFDFLRDNLTDEGITSGFTVLDDTDNEVIKAQAMDELFDWYIRNDYDTVSELYDRFCNRDHSRLMKVISSLDRFLSSVSMSDKWLDAAIEEYKKPFEESIYYEHFFSEMAERLRRAVELAEENVKMLPDIFPDDTVKAVKDTYIQAQADLERAENMLILAEKRRFPTPDEIRFIAGFESLVTIRANVQCDVALRNIYKIRRGMIKDTVKETLSQLSTTCSDFEESARVAEMLAGAVRKLHEIVWEKKCERNAISFDDGERLALELLADTDENGCLCQSEIARQTAEYYDIVMIDEYQDSNNKEDLIFKLISKDFRVQDGSPMYGRNAFLVGDVKQSIYGFRLANPRNFISVMKSSEPYESKAMNRYILLNQNFRSSPQVIDFVNFVFSSIMSESCGDIDYNDDEKLYFGADRYNSGDPSARLTHINFINSDPVSVDGDDEITESLEAEVTASKIEKMLLEKAQVIEDEGVTRSCTPGDFCILVRNNRFSKAYVSALEKRGIPVKGSEEKGYLRSQEIAVLIDLLRIIANPLQDVPLAAVMVSPMYMFTIAEIARIKAADNTKPLYPLVKKAASEPETVGAELSVRCAEFLRNIDKFRLDSVTMRIGALIASIYEATDFIPVMHLRSDGEKKRANLRALIQYASNYEASAAVDGRGGLTGFLRHIDRIMENGDYEQGKVPASSGNFVTVQTLHKSKGLEYPFVFIAETSVNFKFDSDSVMCSDDGRMGFVLYDKKLMRRYKTFQQKMLRRERENSSRSEEMRLLYVGMTRAKQQLFINLSCGGKSLERVRSLADDCVINTSDIAPLVGLAKSYSDWIWLCLMKHSQFTAIVQELGINVDEFGIPAHEREDELFTFEVYNAASVSSFTAETPAPAAPDPEIVGRIRAMINAPYDSSLTEVSAKLSVTQITRKFRDDEVYDLRLARPRFISAKNRLTGAERGTAIHSFFQFCNFDNAIADPQAEVGRLKAIGQLTAMQAESISTDKIRAFFESGLYRRISASSVFQREKKFTVAAAQLDIGSPEFDRIKRSDGMIKGIIDLVFDEGDGLVIVDYKSDRGVSAEELRERYTMQLMIYKAALELTSGRNVKELLLYSIELEKEIVIMQPSLPENH